MRQLEKQVKVHLHTLIDDAGVTEEASVQAIGRLVRKGKFHVLTFTEQIDGQDALHNFITIQQNQVSIKRTGAVMMQQKFITEQMTENVYHHPHGKMHMETFTNSISFNPEPAGNAGKLVLSYTLKLNGQNERKHILELSYFEEDSDEHS